MRQSELMTRVRDYLTANPPESWQAITEEAEAGYSFFRRFEAFGDQMAVAILPAGIEWEAIRGRGPRPLHRIDIVLYGRNKDIEKIALLQAGLEDLAEVFLTDCGPIDNIDCVGVATVPAAEAGYDKSRIHKTDEPYIGGIRLEFR